MIKKLLLLILIFSPSFFTQNKGHLVIIGGGSKPEYVLKKIVEFAGGENAKIIVIPNASSEKLETGIYNANEFKNLGCKNADYILFDNKTADNDSNLNKIIGATGIYFSGGDQSLLTKDLLGTKLFKEIKNIYKSGGVISGTSAGAAVMSQIMLTGNELLNKDSSAAYNSIIKNNIETVEGFGFVKSAVIDQHFIKRKRLNRLISVTLEHPDLIGIGIDESTSIIVNPDETFDVLGESQVIIFDPNNSKNIKSNSKGKLGVSDLKVSILVSGDRYDLKNRNVIQ